MARTAGANATLCKEFLQENPTGTYKDFAAANPDSEVTMPYFAALKSSLKKKGELGGEEKPKAKKAAKAEKEPKKVVKAKAEVEEKPKAEKKAKTPPTNGKKKVEAGITSALQSKINDHKEFLAWVEFGVERNYIDMLKDHLQ
jgi:hypothetical protein